MDLHNENGTFSDLHIKVLDEFDEGRRVYMLTKEFTYVTRHGEIITVPEGTKTDFASVPGWLRFIFPPDGPYLKAAVVHDYYYSRAIGTKQEADHLFKDGMLALKIPRFKRFFLYHGAKYWGKGAYGDNRQKP